MPWMGKWYIISVIVIPPFMGLVILFFATLVHLCGVVVV
jgi:hypothetical protein